MLTAVFFLLHEGHQVANSLLHYARGFHHLRQEHLSRAEQIADDVHAVHQRTFDHLERALRTRARFLDVDLDEIRYAVHQRVRQPFLDRLFAPREIDLFRLLSGPWNLFASSSSRSAASGRRLRTTSSQASRNSKSRSS